MNLKKKIFRTALLVGAATTLILSGCTLPGTEQAGPDGAVSKAPVVIYTAGNYYDGTNSIACYWTGTSRTKLSGNVANSIYVPYGVVLVAGSYKSGSDIKACYWRGGTIQKLPSSGTSTIASGIHYGKGIYTSGSSFGTIKAGYWKYTNKMTALSGRRAEAIYVYGGTPYTAGSYESGTKTVACYWKGTTRTSLPSNGHSAYALSIYVYGGTVYTSGWYWDEKALVNVACYWKGTTRVDLSGSIAYSINVYGGTVYTSGYYTSNSKVTPCYWKGRTRTTLPVPTNTGSRATSICVFGGKIYTAGYYTASKGDVACYWIGTSRTNLPVPSGATGIANSIYVTN